MTCRKGKERPVFEGLTDIIINLAGPTTRAGYHLKDAKTSNTFVMLIPVEYFIFY